MARPRRARQGFTPAWAPLRVFIHRLRKRYSSILREEIARTVSDPAEIEDEIHALCEALVASEGRLAP